MTTLRRSPRKHGSSETAAKEHPLSSGKEKLILGSHITTKRTPTYRTPQLFVQPPQRLTHRKLPPNHLKSRKTKRKASFSPTAEPAEDPRALTQHHLLVLRATFDLVVDQNFLLNLNNAQDETLNVASLATVQSARVGKLTNLERFQLLDPAAKTKSHRNLAQN